MSELDTDKFQLIGVAKILDILWVNSYYVMGKDASKRLEEELVYYFGENWASDMYDFILEDGVSKPSCHPETVKTLETLKSDSTGIRKGDLSEARTELKDIEKQQEEYEADYLKKLKELEKAHIDARVKYAVTEVLGRLKEQAVTYTDEWNGNDIKAIPVSAIKAEEKRL